MIRVFEWFGRNGTWVLPVGIVVGLVVQPLAHLLRPLLTPLVVIILVTVMARLDVAVAIAHLRRPIVLLVGIVWAVIVVPILVWGVIYMTGPSEGLALALVIYATSPPNFAAAALSYVMGLEGAFTTAMIFGTVFLHPVTTPFFIDLFTGGVLQISSLELAMRLAAMIGSAAVLAIMLRCFLGEARRMRFGVTFDGINMLVMVIFVIGLMDGIPQIIAARPVYTGLLIVLCFALHLVFNAVTVALFWWSHRRLAPTIGYCSGGRNIVIVMGALGSAAPPDAWLFFVALQFPIYLLPVVLKPFYRWWLRPPQAS